MIVIVVVPNPVTQSMMACTNSNTIDGRIVGDAGPP